MIHLDLFSGIGGFAYAVDQVWDNVEHIFCDNDKFCQQVLKKHWPESEVYNDIRDITNANHARRRKPNRQKVQPQEQGTTRTQPPNLNSKRHFILTGGFPCQPFSAAGNRRGTSDDRYLWPEMLRVIRLTKPKWVIAENVRGLLTLEGGVVFEQVCADLEASGYEVQPFIIPAVAVNAPHRRDRIWFVAHAIDDRQGRAKQGGDGKQEKLQKKHRPEDSASGKSERTAGNRQIDEHAKNSISQRSGGRGQDRRRILGSESSEVEDEGSGWESEWLEVATQLCSVDDGLPGIMGNTTISKSRHRKEQLKAYGNAIVPQVAQEILRAIRYSEEQFHAGDNRAIEDMKKELNIK